MAKVQMSAVRLWRWGRRYWSVSCLRTVGSGMINGTIMGDTVSGSVKVGNQTYDVTSTTISMAYFTNCYFISNGMMAQFPTTNFAFAGYGVASNIANIDPSDFTISQYIPWVINNNNTTNFVNGPNRMNYNRSLTNVDGGGADIVINYAPKTGDPTNVNFLQGVIRSASWVNNGAVTSGNIDTRAGSPSTTRVFSQALGQPRDWARVR